MPGGFGDGSLLLSRCVSYTIQRHHAVFTMVSNITVGEPIVDALQFQQVFDQSCNVGTKPAIAGTDAARKRRSTARSGWIRVPGCVGTYLTGAFEIAKNVFRGFHRCKEYLVIVKFV